MAKRTARKPAKVPKKATAKRVAAKPALLAGGNPQIAKGYGDAPVQAYIAAMPGWKRDIGRRVDALGESKHKQVRYLDIHESDLDEAQLAAWVKQASQLPGERM
jgi:hypothetical protein